MRNIYKMREWKRNAISPPWWNPPWRDEGAYLTKTFSPQCINKNSSERCCYVRSEQTDLVYANAKDLIQSWRIYIRVASLYLASFVTRRFWFEADLYPISMYIIFSRAKYIISFLSSLLACWSFVFGGEIWHFRKWRWRNLAEAPGMMLTT